MNLISQWFQSNLGIVYLIYGLAFVIIGIAILVQPRQEIKFKFSNILWLFIAYALIHAPSDFLDMWGVIKGRSEAFYIIGQILTYVSYLFLFEFGRRLIGITKKVFSWWILPIIVAGIVIISVLSGVFWATANILIGYFVRFPAGVMAGLGFIWYYNLEKKTLEPLRLKRYFYMAGASLLAWSFFCGIVRAKAAFFPANWLNTDSFHLVVKIPVYVFRTICAIILSASFFGILGFIRYKKETFRLLITLTLSVFLIELSIMFALHIFFPSLPIAMEAFLDSFLLIILVLPLLYRFAFSPLVLEIIQRKHAEEELGRARDSLESQVQERTKELTKTNELLGVEITERRQAEEEIKRNYDIQNVFNSLLKFSLKDASINEVLEYTLGLLFSVSWLAFESRGAIFMVEDNPEVLIMKVQSKLAEPIQKACAQVPFGKCLCGRAAATQKIQFSGHIDERHETRYEGILPHGHYCVPILFAGRTLGVMNLYVKEGHRRDQKEEDFLLAVADILAGILIRKNTQDKLKNAYEQLRQAQAQLIQSAKMASVGLLAAGVAHEINNPTFVISGEAEMLLKEKNKDKETKEAARAIFEQAERISKITNRLLEFSRQKEVKRGPLDVNKIMEKSISLLGYQAKIEEIEIVKEFTVDLPKTLGDENQIQEVFLNIMLNAVQAMEGKGRLTLRTYSKKITEDEARKTDKFKARDEVVLIEIKDTGKGMNNQTLNRLFNPFFTTKEKGVGLGLFICYGMIDNHRGVIEVESKLGEGSTFIIKLAVSNQKEA